MLRLSAFCLLLPALAAAEELESDLSAAKQALAAGEYTEAIERAEAALGSTELDDESAAAALGLQATAWEGLGETGLSLSTLHSALNFQPNNPWLLIRSCEGYSVAGYLPRARRDCGQARRVLRRLDNPVERADAEAHLNFAEARLALIVGDSDRALGLLDAIPQTGATSPPPEEYVEFLRGQALARRGDLETAIDAYDRALDMGSMSPRLRGHLHYLRGIESMELGRYDAARPDLEAAHELTGRPQWLYTLCSLGILSGDTKRSLEDCGRLVEQEPDNSIYHDALGTAQLAAGDAAAALDTFRDALDLDPGNETIYAHWREAVQAAGRAGEAEKLPVRIRALHE